MPKKVRLLNVEIDDLTLDELVDTFKEGMLMTLHVDMIMKLQKDREFHDVLPNFSPITCDSQILVAAARLLGTPLRGRVSGSDFFPRFYTKWKDDPSVTMFICGGGPGIAEIAARKINEKVGRSMVVGTDSPPLGFESRPEEIDRPHPLDEPIDRSKRVTEQDQVGRQHHDERSYEDGCLDERNRGVNGHRRQREQQRRDNEQRRVDREHPPQERKP